MSGFVIKLPDEVSQQVQDRGISQQRLESMVAHFVQEMLREWDEQSLKAENSLTDPESEWTGGRAFARQVIANNRELFEELARL